MTYDEEIAAIEKGEEQMTVLAKAAFTATMREASVGCGAIPLLEAKFSRQLAEVIRVRNLMQQAEDAL